MSINETPEESVFTVNFRKAWITPEYKRTNRVVRILREFAKRHMKTDDIKIDQYLNRYLWQRGKRNPPRKVRIRMTKDETDTVVLSLYEGSKERKPTAQDLELKEEAEEEAKEEEAKEEAKEEEEAKEVKEKVSTPKKKPSKKKKEAETRGESENDDSAKSAVEPDAVSEKQEPALKTANKPKKKSSSKKKSADQAS